MHMGTGNVFFLYTGIHINTFYLMVPFTMNLRITQQAIVQSEIPDKQVGTHDRRIQYATGKSRSRGLPLEIHAQIGNVEHIPDINVLEIHAHGVLSRFGQRAMNAQVPFPVAKIEVVNMYLSRIDPHLRRMDFPQRIVHNDTGALYVDQGFQWGCGKPLPHMRLFPGCCRIGQSLLADKPCPCSQFSAVRHQSVITPIQRSYHLIFMCICFHRDIYGTILPAVGQAGQSMKPVVRILAQHHSRLDKPVSITQTREIAFHTHPSGLVIERPGKGGMSINLDGQLKHVRQDFGIIYM